MVNTMTEANDSGPDGLAQLRALMASERKAPLLEKMDIRLVEVERGRVVFEGTPDRSVYNPLGSVHGGYAATMLDSACGIAAHSTQGPNRGHTTLELKVSYLRALDDRSGTVRAVGRTISVGRRVAFTEATLHDGEGRLCATATSTILVFDVEPTKRGALQA
jgi:uncharacterized protein (TIGR00369 family)